jgi:hypothetical protein
MTLLPGAWLGPYAIVNSLGAGGMGEVYRARDPRLGRDVAIKILPGEFSADADRLRRFEQEARAAAALNHPNILAVHDLGTHDGAPSSCPNCWKARRCATRSLGERYPFAKPSTTRHGRSGVVAENQLSSAARDHVGRRIGPRPRIDLWHHGNVRHAQTQHAMHAKLWVDDCEQGRAGILTIGSLS